MEDLAQILDLDVENVKQAISVYCRLNFAKKKNSDFSELYNNTNSSNSSVKYKWHPSWLNPEKTENSSRSSIAISPFLVNQYQNQLQNNQVSRKVVFHFTKREKKFKKKNSKDLKSKPETLFITKFSSGGTEI